MATPPIPTTSVAIRTRNLPFLNASMVVSRVACGTSPCRAFDSNFMLSSMLSSLHSSLVSQNMMTRPFVPAYMEITVVVVVVMVVVCECTCVCVRAWWVREREI